MASPDTRNCLSQAEKTPNPILDKYKDDAVSRAIPLASASDSHWRANPRRRRSPAVVAIVSVDDPCVPVNNRS